MSVLVVGADIGGTSTRAAVATADGSVLALAVGGPGSPVGVGLESSAAEIRSVVDAALDGIEGVVVAYVLGLAGGSTARDDAVFAAAIRPGRSTVPPTLVSDPAVAFCSATPAPEGYVLVGGTGAVAARVADGEVTAWSDGLGWLLGDLGSGFWLGREAVRRTLLALQRGDELTPLQRAVVELAGSQDYVRIVSDCYADRPTAIGRYAPLVSEHVSDSPDAAAIAAEAADALTATLSGLEPEPDLPVVLAGSLLSRPTPIAQLVRARLGERRNPVLTATEGTVGACWLALGALGIDDPSVHARLNATAAGLVPRRAAV
ncbi:MAG TPA: BadF/BadG/BcrA/BcrD ATPase family protein [Microlunatus sp.]|nr:BadF/BadG/BcrA/BcrD ATPase family protein [Microlunatus sp.]